MKKVILWCLVFVWMGVIFCFSAMNSVKSDAQSKGVIFNTVKAVVNLADNINITQVKPTEDKIMEITNSLNIPIRKLAHFSIYFVLAIFVFLALDETNNKYKWNFAISLGICFVYSLTDEFHQLFIDGRAGQFRDCLIDSFGAFVACIIYSLITKRIKDKNE